MEDVESRFIYLLQPIRDMTRNWEVDISAQLREYMEELDQICISFDGGKTTMNFSEAALLIQGSACIYSKKVEYLYDLVYQALDSITEIKRAKKSTSVGQDGVDKDANFPHDKEEEFLVLDDIDNRDKGGVGMKKDHDSSMIIVPLKPVALVPPEEAEKTMTPVCSRKGEILASKKDFNMNTFTPRSRGVFMFELMEMSQAQCKQNIQMTENGSYCLEPRNAEEAERNEHMEEDCGEAVPVLNFSDTVVNNGVDAFVPLNDYHEAEDENMEYAEHIERQQIQSEERGYVLRQREVKEMPITNIKDNVLNPWRILDACVSGEDKPFKKGKHYTVPRGLTDDTSLNKRKRKLPCKLQDFLKWFSSTFWDGSEAVKHGRKGPTFADMDALYWKHTKEKLALQRQLQKRRGPLVTKVADLLAEEEPANPFEEPREVGYLDHEDCADLSDYEDFAQTIPAILNEDPAGVNIEPVDFHNQISYEELIRQNAENFVANSQKFAQETPLSLRVRAWEEKICPQLQEQEEQGAFDIHDYGDRLVSQFNHVGEWHTFASLMAHRQPYEVCRYMLASLQLANDYTVEVAQKPGLHEGVDTMSLRLLSQQRAHERFKTYTAPSLAQQ